MTNELIVGRSTIHECNCETASPCEKDCTCKQKGVSPVIDADELSIMTLAGMKGEIVEKMREVEAKHSAARDAELKPLAEEYDRLDALLMEHYRPGCFGSMSCLDSIYELCPSATVKACQQVFRGRA